MGIPVAGYFGQLYGGKGRSSECQQEVDSGGRLCRLNQQPQKSTEEIKSWNRRESQSGEEEDRSPLWEFSRSLCVGLEIWGGNLRQRSGQGNVYGMGQCTPGRTGYGQTGDYRRSGCVVDASTLSWGSLGGRQKLFYSQGTHRTLAICMDIVSMIIRIFKLRKQERQKRETLDKANACDTFYRELSDWGGPLVARKIMKQWFVGGNEDPGVTADFTLSGRDLYEIISEFMFGDGRGDKGLICDYVSTLLQSRKQKEEAYTTRWGTDATVSSCKTGEGLCDRPLLPAIPSEEPSVEMNSNGALNGERSEGFNKGVAAGTGSGPQGAGQALNPAPQGKDGAVYDGAISSHEAEALVGSVHGMGAVVGGIVALLMMGGSIYGYYRIASGLTSLGVLRRTGRGRSIRFGYR
ncbi:hypothetical protein C922_05154 [Plasmodium inui San Antonio 1]|uniref:Uncharacterized protein n=1 Tax=Plasmodium inui San Antonio 1 TaxID=1237626 RepID=W7AGP6_9APIC|nr:hypothetical protein C922_05154 [Plasmodium inui San Antonio 1]EUD64466.1 hypothetical protein C922_05154 [Plasmodium inui San Antonio 1]